MAARDVYNFVLVKNFPKYKTFEIVRQRESSFLALFLKTFSKLLKGD